MTEFSEEQLKVIQRNQDLERMLLVVTDELNAMIKSENKRLKSTIRGTDLDEPDYVDHQTVHEAMKLLSK